MKFYKIQILFILALTAVYLGGSAASWWLASSKEYDRQLSTFHGILEDREEFLKDLIPQEQEEFPNYEKKLTLLKLLHSPWIRQVRSILTNPKKNWKSQLKTLGIPFPKASGLFIGRGSRVLYQTGRKFEETLGEKWAKQTFLAIQGGQDTFMKRQRLYFMPISFEEFQQFRNSFQTIFYYGKFIYRYYLEIGPFRLLLLLGLKEISQGRLGEEVQSYILKLDPSLSPSKGDVFEFNWQQVTVADNAAGLKWKGKYPSFPEYLVQRHFWNLGFLLVLIYVAYLGGFRVFYLRFESKVFVRYFLFLGVLYLCLLYLERYIHRGTLLLDHQRAEEAWESSVKQLDRGFQTYLEELGSRVRYSFKNKNPLNDDTLYKDGLHALLLSPPSNATQSSTKIDSFSSTYLLRLTLSLAATHFSLGEAGSRADKPVANELEVYKSNLLVRTAISRQYEIEKLESKVPTWVKSADDSDPYFAENIFDEGVKILGQKGEWLHHQVLMIKQYFLGLIENTAEGPRVLGATINAGSAFLRYLEEAAFSEGNPLAGGVFMVQSADGQLFTFPRAEQWDREFFEEHWNRTRLSSEGSIRIEVNSKNYLGTFYPSEAVGSFRYLILQSEDEVLRTSNELKKRFANFHIWFWIFGLLFSVFLARVIIRPLEVLREGFQKLRAKNFDFSLSIRGVDEGSQMIQGFNEMVVGLAQKEKMIPYVNAALQDLLEKKSDSEDSELYSGRAIVLMSDIRSFTTLSEERNPEEVVEMLGEYFGFWQTRVERYQGVIERFIGDAVVALFFEKNSRHFVQQALQCSLEVQHDLRAWNKARKARGLFAVKNGVGLALGEIAFDLVGTAERMEFLSIGEPIERAELLETKTKAGTSTDIFVDYQVEKELRGLYDFEKRGELSRGETYFEVIEGEE